MEPLGDFSTHDKKAMLPFLKKLGKGVYLEIGVKHGQSLAFARANAPEAEIYGIDPDGEAFDKEYFKDKDVHYINMGADEASETWKKEINLLFIDGDHSFEQVKKDIENYLPFVNGYILFHDFDISSPGVYTAVDDLCLYRNKVLHNLRYSEPGLKTSIAMVEHKK